MITPPGSKRFKIHKLDPPQTGANGIKYTLACDELLAPKCPSCHNGQIHVAYGEHKGLYDVYRLPCRCIHVNGLEWWQTDNVALYSGRPIAYSCKETDLPEYVFIHPVHAAKRMKTLHMAIRRLVENMLIQQEELKEAVPF